ncbi:MAG TPA: YbaK/EbsC family protein [Candidatus Binatia bacterium]|nr:YbaK/EbsC family protein [Candidatus Binatia bacterium]
MLTSAEQKVISAVDALGVPYELIPIDPAYADTAAFCQHYGYPLECSANTIIVASHREPKQLAACVVLATTQLDVNKRVRKLLGVSRASFATAEEMMALTGMQVGGVTPFALPAGLSLYVDARIMQLDWILLGSGGRAAKIKIAPAVFITLGAVIVADLGRERSTP